MKAHWDKLAWIALATVLMVVGCGPSATQPAPTATTAAAFPTGVFTKASWTWELKPDGTYHAQDIPHEAEFSGVYTVTENQIVINWDGPKCKDVLGTYTWAYDGNALTLEAVGDKCPDRYNIFHLSRWVKKP